MRENESYISDQPRARQEESFQMIEAAGSSDVNFIASNSSLSCIELIPVRVKEGDTFLPYSALL